MSLKKVELIRSRVLRGMQGELVRLRNFISIAGENEEAVELLRGQSGDTILALVTDTIMRELGQVAMLSRGEEVDALDAASPTRRLLTRQRRVT